MAKKVITGINIRGTGSNGVGSTPYTINEFNQDNFPLLNSVKIENYVTYSSTVLPYTSSPTPHSTSNNNPSPSLTPTPSVPELSWLMILSLLLSIPIVLGMAEKESTRKCLTLKGIVKKV